MTNLLHKGKNILFFDIDTVGFPKKDTPIGITEVGMKFVPALGFSKEIEELSQLYSINETVPYEITKITGITNAMLEGMPSILEHIELMQDKVNRADVIVAHNAPFDIRCLELVGMDFEGKEIFDTATHSRRMFPELPKHTMGDICNHLEIQNGGAHRAIHDVNAMIKIYLDVTDVDKHRKKLTELTKKHKKLTYTKIKKK